jgi:hypothetical protein
MNPRIFCREDFFPRALALTYSFDPLFFERIVLRDLYYGGSKDLTVVGDQNELREAVTRYSGQFNYLGKSYLLAPAETAGAFHPKLLLRIGNKGARLLMGSGNITFGGWGGNRELAYQLNLDANLPGSAVTVNHILTHVSSYLTSEVGRNSLDRLRDYPWLAVTDDSISNILMTTPDEPLAAQLQRRWAGRRFNSMVIFTGSTDEHGAFIRWCHDQFGVEECVVAVSPENASFVKDDIDRCPVRVSLAPFVGSQMLHAKFYWFDGPDGPAAIVGSANCSSAAWLRSPLQGRGNVETIQIYDFADPKDFEAILSVIPDARVAIERCSPTEKPVEDQTAPFYFVKAIHLHRGHGFLDVVLNQPLPGNAVARLIGPPGIEITLLPTDNGLLKGQVSETVIWPETTCLAKVQIVVDGGSVFETPMHWLDDMDAISQTANIKPPAEPFKNLPRSRTSSEHDKVVSDLAMISASIFSESAAYRDPPRRRAGGKQTDNGRVIEPVKPEDLVKSLNDVEVKQGELSRDAGAGVYLSMNGVMRALFEEVESLPVPDDGTIITDPDVPVSPVKRVPTDDTSGKKDRELPADRHRKRLKDDLNDFFDKFSAEKFANDCTASKLVQAAAYPLAIALLGERGGWLLPEESSAAVTRVVDILLNRNRVGRNERGLLEEVCNRYRVEGQEDIFLQVVGDGTLWVVLLAVMAQLSWKKKFDRFERAINLHRVYGCDAMRSDTNIGKLTTLVTRLDVEKAHELIACEAPCIATAIEAIEKLLREGKDTLLAEQLSQEHQVGDLIWHPEVGWGLVNGMSSSTTMDAYLHLRGETRKVAKKSFYLNLRMASEKSIELKKHLDAILLEQPRTAGVMGMLS